MRPRARVTAITAAFTLALGSLLLGCEEPQSVRAVASFRLFDRPVRCDPASERCATADGVAAPFEEHGLVRAYISAEASRFAPDGYYLYMELQRPGGQWAIVELDLPFTGQLDQPPVASYLEYQGAERVFQATRVQGQVELQGDQSCPCQDGRLELLFSGPGADGELGTADDRVRRLSRAVFGRGRGLCLQPRTAEVDLQRELDVLALDRCTVSAPPPVSGHDPDPGYDPGYYETDVGCAASDDPYYDEGGCEADTYDTGSEDSGCEGDTYDSDYDSGGCEGDSSSSSYDSGGCEGDSSASSSSCEGDALAAAGPGRAGRRIQRAAGLGLPWTLALGVMVVLRTLSRRRSRRSRR